MEDIDMFKELLQTIRDVIREDEDIFGKLTQASLSIGGAKPKCTIRITAPDGDLYTIMIMKKTPHRREQSR